MSEANPILLENEQIDQLGYHGLKIIQNPAKFKFTIDSFLLAAFVNPKPGQKVVDLGTGGGVLALLIAGQSQSVSVLGIEIQGELAEMARRSVALNELGERVTILEADLRNLPADFKLNSFDHVISNPPFFPVNKGIVPEKDALAIAKFEIACTMEELVKAAARLVKGNGRISLVYPSERCAELLTTLESHHLTAKRICFIHPFPETPGNLVLVEARPGAKPGLEVLPPVYVCQANHEYSEKMYQIFRGMKI